MKILLTGIDGYTGWPLALAISKKFKKSSIVGVDNLMRRRWVSKSNSISAIPIKTMKKRISTAKRYGFSNIKFIKGDLTNLKFTNNLVKKYKIDTTNKFKGFYENLIYHLNAASLPIEVLNKKIRFKIYYLEIYQLSFGLALN